MNLIGGFAMDIFQKVLLSCEDRKTAEVRKELFLALD